MTKILVTGAAGHLGAAFVDRVAKLTDWDITILARRFGGRLKCTPRPVTGFLHDFRAPIPERLLREFKYTDYIFHIGGEVHGIRSVADPEPFVQSNVVGTFHMLEVARQIKPRAFVYVSSAEVYGPSDVAFMPELYLIPHKETATLQPQNPYAASKAAAEALVHSYYRSYGVPTITARTMNLFGERQAADKFIPKIIRKVVDGEIADIHTSETGADLRQWIHTEVFSDALLFLAQEGLYGSIYNVAGAQFTNRDIALLAAKFADKALSYRTKDTSSSPAHNIAYAINDEKIRAMGWQPTMSFEASLFRTVRWTLDHPEWQ